MRRVFPGVEDSPGVHVIPLVDADGTGIAVEEIEHIYLTLWNAEVPESSQNLINERDHVEVKGANGGTVSDDGVLTWATDAADNPVLSDQKVPGENELHQFELEIHLTSGEPFRLLYGIRVRKMQKGLHAS